MGNKGTVLFVATVVKKHINVFHLPFLKWFQEEGYKTHVAARDDFNGEKCYIPYCNKYFNIIFERSPLKFNNYKAYKELKKIINENNYKIIHCHTPVAAILTRLAARKARKKGTQVIYTAHGFHFFKGAPYRNWLIYFPVEFLCSIFTDVLITINMEDYHLAQKWMLAKQVHYVPGVGIDTRVKTSNIGDKRKELAISADACVLLSVGELTNRKNHEMVIKSLARLNKKENIVYIICGQGELEGKLKQLSRIYGVEKNILFLGFRRDIMDICKMADIFVFPSRQEGLPVSIMEAMSAGLPIICTDIRGNRDLVEHERGGLLIQLDDDNGLYQAIIQLNNSKKNREKYGKFNSEKIKKYDKENIIEIMKSIYIS